MWDSITRVFLYCFSDLDWLYVWGYYARFVVVYILGYCCLFVFVLPCYGLVFLLICLIVRLIIVCCWLWFVVD